MIDNIKSLTRYCLTSVDVIPMGTDLTNTFVLNNNVLRKSNQLLFVGRLVEKKGVLHLIHALNEINKTMPDIQLIIAGSGPLEKDLKKLTTDLRLNSQIIFTGRLEHKSLAQLYQESTLAIFPFVQAKNGDMEGLGLVMIEAMGCGCPIVASDLPAVKDVIEDRKTGYLVEPSNSINLAEAIKQLLTDTVMRQQLSERAHQRVHKNFDWQTVAQSYQTLLLNNNQTMNFAEIFHVK